MANDDVGAGAASVTINNVPDPALEGEYTYIDDATGLPVTVAAGTVLSPTEAASMMFVPVADFNGMVTTVMYTVTDINGETSDANIDITITPTPDAVDDTYQRKLKIRQLRWIRCPMMTWVPVRIRLRF